MLCGFSEVQVKMNLIFMWPFPPWSTRRVPRPYLAAYLLDLQVLNVFEPSVPLSNLVKIGQRLHKLLGKMVRQSMQARITTA